MHSGGAFKGFISQAHREWFPPLLPECACTGCSPTAFSFRKANPSGQPPSPFWSTPPLYYYSQTGLPCGCHGFVMRIWAGCCLSEEKWCCFLEMQQLLHGTCVCYSVVNVTEAEGPPSTPGVRAVVGFACCSRAELEAGSSALSPAKPRQHCWLEEPGCVGTTAGGYLVTKGKPPSQGGVTGCLVSDFRGVRTRTTAVWVKLEACHIPVVLILLFTEIKIEFLHGART